LRILIHWTTLSILISVHSQILLEYLLLRGGRNQPENVMNQGSDLGKKIHQFKRLRLPIWDAPDKPGHIPVDLECHCQLLADLLVSDGIYTERGSRGRRLPTSQ